jgi:hypothetical protein
LRRCSERRSRQSPAASAFGWGIVAGLLHSAAALTVGSLHAGLNLYNNGFAAGVVAAFLVPVIVALRAGFGYREDLDAEAAQKT